MKIRLTKLRHKNGKPVVIVAPKLPKGFRAEARKAGRKVKRAFNA